MLYTKESIHYAEVQVSEILESYRIPDPYIWKFNKNGKFIPQNDKTETPIENIIVRNNLIGEIEYQAFLKIQEKAFAMNSGYILWISPTHPVYYPYESKIIISEKIGEVLINRSVGVDWSSLDAILVAQELSTLSNLPPNTFRSANDVRANPIFIDKDKEELLNTALKRMLTPETIHMIKTGEDWKAKKIYMDDYLAGKHIALGSNPLSCPIGMEKSAFRIFAGAKEIMKCVECPFCKKTVDAEIYDGEIHCPECKKSLAISKPAA